MATKEQLLRKVKNLQSNNIKYILHKLGENQESSQNIELLDDDIESIREILSILIDKDETFATKFQTIIEEDNQHRSGIDYTTIVGIVTLGTIANNLIIAKSPTKVIDKDISIERDYSTLSQTLKSLAEVLKSIK
ncbi:hypothetical protein MNB_SV-15-233 [hydrothermal vent metagenome]|uniref:Uncharacterized protein n=1 Tax=hydrothermal vent metagenome TaxID=652676 RepID=A0A1W1EHK3_9ZZZZ